MNPLRFGIVAVLLGAAILVAVAFGDAAGRAWLPGGVPIGLALGGLLLAAGVVALFTAGSRRGRSFAVLRLDWYLPFLRKKKQKETLNPPALPVRLAQRVLPAFFFADRLTGKPGLFRRAMRRVGPTMLSSPVRRVVQAACFVLFLVLFFYVCWPYTAAPAPNSRLAADFSLDSRNEETGDVTLAGASFDEIKPGAEVHLLNDQTGAANGYAGRYRVKAAGEGSIVLSPLAKIAPEEQEALRRGIGSWSLHDRHPWPAHYADDLAGKETLHAETFLIIDPLVALSTSVAARSWVWSLIFAGVILLACVLIPRGFCGYLCPLGTLIDLFDWAVAGRVKRLRVPDEGWWVHIKYYLLAGVMLCAVFGVLVSGFVAAIPVVTRGLLFLFEPAQSATLRGTHLVPPMNWGHALSIGLFLAVLGLGFLRPRFWCKYVCPSGAVFSLGNLFRVTERKVESTCIHCNKCVEICPFDAIKPDFTTRVTDCTLCQTCAGVCPTHAIKFVERWNFVELKTLNDPPTGEKKLGRRGFLSLAAGTAAAVVGAAAASGATKAWGAGGRQLPVRPPGSVPEPEFLTMCIRCGECFKACPNNVLQAMGFEQGLEGLWTPQVVADWAGCESSCNACGQVCPTGAIRALPLEEKRRARMGLAIVNERTCLPIAGVEECDRCVVECNGAGYHAIEQIRVGTKVDKLGRPIEGSGFLAPVVNAQRCVGCGLCQTGCYNRNVQGDKLQASAIIVEAGEGKEDRLMRGSYIELRRREIESQGRRRKEQQQQSGAGEFFIPGGNLEPPADDDPFGTGPPQLPDDDPFGLDGA